MNKEHSEYIVKVLWEGEVFEEEIALVRSSFVQKTLELLASGKFDEGENKFYRALYVAKVEWLDDFIKKHFDE